MLDDKTEHDTATQDNKVHDIKAEDHVITDPVPAGRERCGGSGGASN